MPGIYIHDIKASSKGSCDSSEPDPESGGDEFDFTVIRGTAARGITEQQVARTLHELSDTFPRLARLGSWLQDVVTPVPDESTNTLEDALTSFSHITSELTRILALRVSSGSSPEPGLQASVQPSSNPTPLLPTPLGARQTSHHHLRAKQSAPEILPPSPEKRQVRKQSHSVH